MKRMISAAELTFYLNDQDDNNFSIELSSTQLAGIIKLLGLQLKPNGEVSMFSDESLKLFMDKTVNKWKLK